MTKMLQYCDIYLQSPIFLLSILKVLNKWLLLLLLLILLLFEFDINISWEILKIEVCLNARNGLKITGEIHNVY